MTRATAGTDRPGAWALVGWLVTLAPKRRRSQDPIPPFPYAADAVRVENAVAGVGLAGTLFRPAGPGRSPAVFMLPGSGKQDRDVEVCGHRLFLVLADHLARSGLVVLRLDDRGVGVSGGDKDDCTHDDLLGDVSVALEFLSQHPSVDRDRIGLLGHSEGALLAAAAGGGRSRLPVAFLVLLACAAGSGEELIHEQAERISRAGGATEEEIAHERRMNEAVFAVLKGPRPREDARAAIAPLLTRALETWPGQPLAPELLAQTVAAMSQIVLAPAFRSLLTCDGAEYLRRVSCPTLALFGDLDLQVPSATHEPRLRAALAAAGNAGVTVHRFPQLNHLFQTAQTGALEEYESIDETMAPAVLDRIAAWIHSNTRSI